MLRVLGAVSRLAGVAAGALPVVEPSRNGGPRDVAIPLGVRVVARRAGHAAIHVAVAVPMALLVGERADASVRTVRLITQLRGAQ